MDQATAVRLLARLGVTPMDLQRVQQTPYPESGKVLDELKVRVRANWKRLVFELHPDRTGNDPVKTEEFKAVTLIRDDFEKLQVQPRPQMPQPIPVQRVHFQRQYVPTYNVSPFSSTNSSSASTTASWHFVVMRPY